MKTRRVITFIATYTIEEDYNPLPQDLNEHLHDFAGYFVENNESFENPEQLHFEVRIETRLTVE